MPMLFMELLQKNKMEENTENIKDIILKFGKRAIEEFGSENVLTLTGEKADNYKVILTAMASMLEERVGQLEIEEAKYKVANIDRFKSSISAKDHWIITELGIEQTELRHLLKSVDKIISSCNTRMSRLKQEAFNQQ